MVDILNKLKVKGVALLFGIFIVVSFMYIYDSNLTLLFLLCSIVLQSLFYIFYDYVATKRRIFQYISIIGSLVAMIFILTIIGSLYTPSNIWEFMLWFLSPQGAMGYSLQYIFVMLVGLNFFISSTLYYFTQVRYRLIVTFVLFMFPFAMYAREDIKIPTVLLLLLIILYFATMIMYGQNNLFVENNLKVIYNKSYFKSVGAFALAFMLIISALPKPQIVEQRTVFENLISAQNLTGFLLSQLGNFTDTSNGSGDVFMNSTRKLFDVNCSETVALKSRTFSNYNFNKNVWLRSDGIKSLINDFPTDTNMYYNQGSSSIMDYDIQGVPLDNNSTDNFKKILNPADFLNAVIYACNTNEDFAKKYHLDSLVGQSKIDTILKTVSIKNRNFSTSFVLNPTRAFEVTSISDELNLTSTYSGIIADVNKTALSNYSEYSLNYYSSAILQNSNVLDILSNLSFDMYGDFLQDLYNIVQGTQHEDVTTAYVQDYNNSVTYSEVFTDCNSEKISKLAEDITKGCNSDIEKARALENYFISNGYTYNADYKSNDGNTIEKFIFTTKTGACYEYSTSMILMARALGLPARYVEGFLVVNSTGTPQKIDITSLSSHAYPEVFISGYGWCYFEPTQTLTIETQATTQDTSQGTKLFIASLIMVVGASLVGLFMVFVYPSIYEDNFRRTVSKKDTKDALSLIILRIRKLAKLSNSQTLEETKQSILEVYKVDISSIVETSNRVFYGNVSPAKLDIKDCLDKYSMLYTTMLEYKKSQKKLKRKSKSGS